MFVAWYVFFPLNTFK